MKDMVEKILDCKAITRIVASEFNTKKPEHEFTAMMNRLEENIYELHQDYQRLTARVKALEKELATLETYSSPVKEWGEKQEQR